jgi:branched-chain amino acid transport system ATP-binding protein
MEILRLTSLSKIFDDIKALSDINFSIYDGEIVGLVGPNGSGKTTLINLISGRLKPSGGHIVFNGKDITHLKPHAICQRGISRTFQSSRPFRQMSSLDNVLVGRLFGKGFRIRSRPEDKKTALALLEVVGIGHKSETLAKDLTLSELRRLDLARALATRPQLLLLDEIAAGFSPVAVKHAVKLIERVRRLGVTLLIIDHFLSLSLQVSDRLLALDHGEMIDAGRPQKVMKNKRVIQAYLGLTHEDYEE